MGIQASTLLQERLYWREQFLNFFGDTTLPHDYRRPFSWQGKYNSLEKCLPKEWTNRICQLTQNHPLSLLIFFTTAWSILFYRYTNEEDIVLATPVYKAIPELENNVVCLRYKVNPTVSAKDLLLQNRTTLLNAFKYQSLEYEDFLKEIGLSRKKNRSLPFSSIISLPCVQPLPNKNDYRSDVFVSVDKGEGLKIKIEYNTELFRQETVDYLSLHFNQILFAIASNVDILIQDIPCLTDKERQLFDSKLQEIEEVRPHLPCIHQRFEEMASLYPDKIALECQEERINYQTLNERANHIANRLIAEERVKEGQFIGFLGERSIEYCIAILGILKAGCAFIPIDSSYPLKRIESVIEDSQLEIILASPKTANHYSSQLSQLHLKWMYVDNKRIDPPQDLNNPNKSISSSHPAYMIYTSGSTGRPKGTIIRHDGKMNHILSSHDSLTITPTSNCLFSASISSDISIWQALVALLCGGKTVIIDHETLFDASRFWSFIEEKEVHIMQFVPTFIQTLLTLLETKKTPSLPALRYLILSGENVPLKLINRWLNYFKHIPVVDAYGPSEASDIVCQELYDQEVDPSLIHTSIGTPLPYVGLFILNEAGKPQPFNVPGEIYIAGIAVGEGYWQDRQKTEAFFIANPFNPQSRYKWYRTGDFGCLLPNGSIEYIGRKDAQVKIRGFRVELGEIESCLLNTGLVKQCKLLVKEVEKNEMLCAYITLSDQISHTKQVEEIPLRLRDYLSAYLPDYMIPNHFVVLDKFPLLAGGKIDVLNLPHPLDRKVVQEIVRPQNEWDQKLVSILSTVLGISEELVGMQSNFFDLGGTSIHLMAAKYQIKEQLHIDVPIEQLFRMDSIQELADFSREKTALISS